MTKALCPVCNVEGYLQIRGSSVRVGHYQGTRENTKVIMWHCTTLEAIKPNMVKQASNNMVKPDTNMVKQKPNLDPEQQNKGGWSSSLVGHLLDVQRVVGSSPARPTTFKVFACMILGQSTPRFYSTALS